jgi:hypothetical protein
MHGDQNLLTTYLRSLTIMEIEPKFSGAGGTPGGVGEFLVGLAMAITGGYLITKQVVVSTGSWLLWGHNSFGLSLLPLIFGIGLLFFNGKSIAGWLLLFAGLIIIFAGILMNLQIYFQPTTLFNTVMMIVLLAGGVGLIARGLAAHKS